MTKSAITSKIHQTFDVHGNFGTKFTFNAVIGIDGLSDKVDVGFGQILSLGARVDIMLCKNLLSGGATHTIDIGQRDIDSFSSGYVYPCNPCQN